MSTSTAQLAPSSTTDAERWFREVAQGLKSLTLAPYLGPAASPASNAPAGYEELAAFFTKKVSLPKRARGNPWASAQYVESQKHRSSVQALLAEAFASPVPPSPLQRYLASLQLPLIVDTWYDGAMRTALSQRSDWAEVQGISRAGIGEDRWYRAYDNGGAELPLERAATLPTLLYKPHGGIVPAQNFLISDADYVEVLTEIDIQTPIPPVVRERRSTLGFVYLGCRFHDQMLRNYARQISKRSSGPKYALVDPGHGLTRNEQSFFAEQEVRVLVCPLSDALPRLLES